MSPKVLHLLFNKLCQKMIDHGSRSTRGPSPSRSRLGLQKYDPPQLKWSFPTTFVKLNFCLVSRLRLQMHHIPCFRAPLTPGSGYRVKTMLRTFLPSKYPMPNFTKIGLTIWISIRYEYIYIYILCFIY